MQYNANVISFYRKYDFTLNSSKVISRFELIDRAKRACRHVPLIIPLTSIVSEMWLQTILMYC